VENFKQDKSKQTWEEIKQKTEENEVKFVIKGKAHKDGNENNRQCESEESNFEIEVR
jgi:RNase H-fold protein (predicted Holliday junction resolvase)